MFTTQKYCNPHCLLTAPLDRMELPVEAITELDIMLEHSSIKEGRSPVYARSNALLATTRSGFCTSEYCT